jgi:hypothetical protein
VKEKKKKGCNVLTISSDVKSRRKKPEMKLGLYTAILVLKFFKDSFSKVLGKIHKTNTLRVLCCGGLEGPQPKKLKLVIYRRRNHQPRQ